MCIFPRVSMCMCTCTCRSAHCVCILKCVHVCTFACGAHLYTDTAPSFCAQGPPPVSGASFCPLPRLFPLSHLPSFTGPLGQPQEHHQAAGSPHPSSGITLEIVLQVLCTFLGRKHNSHHFLKRAYVPTIQNSNRSKTTSLGPQRL